MTAEPDHPPMVTVTEAAQIAGVDRRTIRRRLDSGDFPHAQREAGRQGPDTGPWLIPVGDLSAAGLTVREPGSTGPDRMRSTEIESLRRALDDALRRAEVAEARAAERERVIEAQELALRTLLAAAAGNGADEVIEIDTGRAGGDGRPPLEAAELAPLRMERTTAAATAPDDAPAARPPPAEPPRAEPPGAEPPAPEAGERSQETVPPVVQPYPEAPRPAPKFSPGAPRKPTPPWVPIEQPAAKRRKWKRR